MQDSFPLTLIKLLSKPEIFDPVWYEKTYPDVTLSGIAPHTHYKRFGILLKRAPNADIQQQLKTLPLKTIAENLKALALKPAVVPAPAEFDDAFYLQTNPHINHRKLVPYAHFLKYGHKDLRAPNADFDVVWYLQNYSHTFDIDVVDPFTHYLSEGKYKGYLSRPPRHVQFNKSSSQPLPARPRRACLFAGYDADTRIDDYVVVYLKELARHADIFYMADCEMPKSELAKLDGIVKNAWAWRHGGYDFGSYSILARDLVGWDALAQYDEVIFANDSCYLVKSLDETFTRMNEKPCAWWGLQATKGIYTTRSRQPFPATDGVLDMDHVRTKLLDQFECDPVYDFHIGSYFTAFRGDVIKDKRFQRIINAVKPEKRKLNIVLKYEVGITHFLIGRGYEFATWNQTITDAHPVYTDVAFDLLAAGFPLFKRYLLAENPYKVSSLAYWKIALTQAGSLTGISQIEDNYLRVSNAQKLYRNFNIIEDGVLLQPPMGTAEFATYDEAAPKYNSYWGFPVCANDRNLSDNGRAIFESVKDDPDILKVIFTRDRTINPGGLNVICVPLLSYEGQIYLARCRNLFVQHDVKIALEWPISVQNHKIIHLQQGIAIQHTDFQDAARVVQRTKEAHSGSRLLPEFHTDTTHKTPKSITFLYSINLDSTNRYRVFTLASQLRKIGWTCYAMDINHAAVEVLQKSEFVTFCHLEMSPQTMDLAEGVRATGGKLIYDTDDLMHEEASFLQSDRFMLAPKLANQNYLKSKRIAEMMMLADGFTAPTPAILDSVKTYRRPIAIVTNGMSQTLLDKYPKVPTRHSSSKTNLVYSTKTPAHNTDFDVCAAALVDLLANRPDVILHIIGPLDITGFTNNVDANQIQHYGLMSYAALHEFLRSMDINLAPLADTNFNQGKSARTIFEAALHGVPTIASPSAPYQDAIDNRTTGYIAHTQQDWRDALYDAVDNPKTRHKIADAARQNIVPAFSAKVAAKQLVAFLERLKLA